MKKNYLIGVDPSSGIGVSYFDASEGFFVRITVCSLSALLERVYSLIEEKERPLPLLIIKYPCAKNQKDVSLILSFAEKFGIPYEIRQEKERRFSASQFFDFISESRLPAPTHINQGGIPSAWLVIDYIEEKKKKTRKRVNPPRRP